MRILKKSSHRNEQQTAIYRLEPFQIISKLLIKDKKNQATLYSEMGAIWIEWRTKHADYGGPH